MNKKIKILRIIARLNIGGPAIHTILLAEGLNRDKFDSLLVAGMVEEGEADMLYLAESKEVKPIIISELGRKINFKKDFISFCKLFKLIKKQRPDIIHTHTAKAGTLGRLVGILYNLAYPKNKCKLVHTFHGHVLHSYFGKFKTKVFIWIERILAKFTDKIIVVSDTIKKELLDLRIGNNRKIIVIPLGLELDKLLNIPPANNPKINIGIIGRLTLIKNHFMFLKSIKLLLTQYSNLSDNHQFVIAGDGELRDSLENYVRELGLVSQIIFTGWHKDLINLYSSLDIVALTSLNEGTPVSLIEAMAAGRPVVATDVGGVRDLLEPVCGLARIPTKNILIKSNDVEGFAKALIWLIDNRDLRAKIGEASREFVRDKFGKETLIKNMERLYKDLLNKKEN